MSIPTFTPGYPPNGFSLGQTKTTIRNNLDGTFQTVAVNHYDNNSANAGRHKHVEMPISASIPPGLINGETTVYSKTDAATTSQLFFSPDNTGNEYQITRAINAAFTLFSTNTQYETVPAIVNGGWTYLPGGMLLQYGTIVSGSSINFAVPFTTAVYFVFPRSGAITLTTLTGFTLLNGSANNPWFAIGK